jgi:hypothetical protein
MAGIQHMVRRKGERTLREDHALPSWRDAEQRWTLPTIDLPSIQKQANYYDTYRFEHHPRSYSPSMKRRQASGYSTRYPKRPAPQEVTDERAVEVAKIAQRRLDEREKRVRDAAIRKGDALLWVAPRSNVSESVRRDATIGTYRAGTYCDKRPEYSVDPKPAQTGYPGGGPRDKPTYNTREFSFTETGTQKNTDDPAVGKYSVSQRLDTGDMCMGYSGHVMGYQFKIGGSYPRRTRQCLHGYEPSPY